MEYFLIIIFLFFIGCLTFVDFSSFFDEKGIAHRSFKNDIVTIGILGTFLGIFLGLYKFDVNNITGSIPPLLGGMKLAFITSIAGMFSSVSLTIIQKFYPSPYSKSGNPVSDKLSDQTRLLAEFLDESKKTNEAIIEQVKNHRIESKDELTKVRESLDKTLKKLSEGATKEIIQALEQVIKEFNDNLTEQFGENFRQLNDACLKLVVWQENYLVLIEKTEKTLAATTDSLSKTSASLSEIANRNEEFENFCNNTSLSLETMNRILENNMILQNGIKKSIDALGKSALDLKEIPPIFKDIGEKMEGNNAKMISSLEVTKTKVEKINNDMEEATTNLNNSLVSLSSQFGENYRVFLDQIKRIMP